MGAFLKMKCFEIDTAICIERINQAKRRLEAVYNRETSSTMCCIEEFTPEVRYLQALLKEML